MAYPAMLWERVRRLVSGHRGVARAAFQHRNGAPRAASGPQPGSQGLSPNHDAGMVTVIRRPGKPRWCLLRVASWGQFPRDIEQQVADIDGGCCSALPGAPWQCGVTSRPWAPELITHPGNS